MKPKSNSNDPRSEASPANSPASAEPQTGDAVQNSDGMLGGDAELDFENLDLSAEAVDERISPSETNVFDK